MNNKLQGKFASVSAIKDALGRPSFIDAVAEKHLRRQGRDRCLYRGLYGHGAQSKLLWQRLEGVDGSSAYGRTDGEL